MDAKEKDKKAAEKKEKRDLAATSTNDKRDKKRQKESKKAEDQAKKAKDKAQKLAMTFKNKSLVTQAEQGTKGVDGAPAVLNKLVEISRMYSLTDTKALYFPGQTPDDKLAVDLANVAGLLSVSYNTRLPTEADYTSHIEELAKLASTLTVLKRQVNNSIDKLTREKEDLVHDQRRKFLQLPRSNSFDTIDGVEYKKRKADWIAGGDIVHANKKQRKLAVTSSISSTTSSASTSSASTSSTSAISSTSLSTSATSSSTTTATTTLQATCDDSDMSDVDEYRRIRQGNDE